MSETPSSGNRARIDRLQGQVKGRVEATRTRAEPLVRRLDESVPGMFYSRLLEMEIVDRAVALAAKLFVAFFPFVLGVSSLLPGSVQHSVRDSLIRRFGLSGDASSIVNGAFATAGQTKAATGLLGALLLFFYATSFTTALQRVYLRAWRRPSGGGVRNQGRGLAWLAGALAFFALNGFVGRILTGGPGDALRLVLALVTSTGVWWWTSHTMLRGEVRWRPLLPGALLVAVILTGYVFTAPIWMPRALASNTAQFGFFGVALSLVSWFLGASFVLVGAAALSAVLPEGTHALARWLVGPEDTVLVAGAPAALPGPTRRLRLIDALGVRDDDGAG